MQSRLDAGDHVGVHAVAVYAVMVAVVIVATLVVVAATLHAWYAAGLSRVFRAVDADGWRAWIPVGNEAELLRLARFEPALAVLAIMALGTVGLAVTGITVTVGQPALRLVLLVALIIATAVVVTITVLAPRARTRLARVADTIELIILAVLLPLGVIAGGWV
ncbi:hypothetical protein [Ralstonia pickettii]|uniref:hypothetical protein n=1 Tax=Ralstonia pickettii TaxID=329 RepID=UPI001CA540C3